MARCRGGSSFRFENLLAYGGCVAIESYVHNAKMRHDFGAAKIVVLHRLVILLDSFCEQSIVYAL